MTRRVTIVIALLIVVLACFGISGCGSASVKEGDYPKNGEVASSQSKEEPSQASQEQKPAEQQPAEEQVIEKKEQVPSGGNLSGRVVTIDPGHQAQGNFDTEPIGPGASEEKAKVSSGTSGVATGIDESQVNLEVALKLRDYLVSRGVNVVMVRESQDVDISNSERAAIANNAGSALFVRLHCDSADGSSRNGFWTLVPGYNDWTAPIVERSRIAGEIVQRCAVAATGATDLGVTERTDLSGFNWCTVPSILCEMGYMSNPDEDILLSTEEYQQKLAQGMGDGVIEYLNTIE